MKRILEILGIAALLTLLAAVPAFADNPVTASPTPSAAAETPAAEASAPAPVLKSNDDLGQVMLLLSSVYSTKELDEGVYVGSEICIACHPAQASWRGTKHSSPLREPRAEYSLQPGLGVVADHDRNGVDDFRQGLDLNAVSSGFNRFKPNAPRLSFAGGTYFITIGDLRMPVAATVGGSGDWDQRYLVRVPVRAGGNADGLSRDLYVSPVQYNEVTRQYVPYDPESWYSGNDPKFGGGTSAAGLAARTDSSFTKNCVGCHITGIRSIEQSPQGEYLLNPYITVLFDPDDPRQLDYNGDGFNDLVGVGCEMCHGAGSRHVMSSGDPDDIVNPNRLATSKANELCGQCHLRVESVPAGEYAWPYNDRDGRMWRPENDERLASFFRDAAIRWPDGVNSKRNHQQYFDFLASEKPDFAFHPVRCDECHAVHGNTRNEHLIRDVLIEGGVRIPTATNDNTLCLACHAPFGPFAEISKEEVANYDANLDKISRVVSEHANHPYAPERTMGLARCTECHMPLIAQSAIEYDIHSHSFEAIPPEKNLAFQDRGGMPDSCSAGCHSLEANVFRLGITDDLGTWNAPFDRRLSRILERWFGPDGIWWDTDE